MRPAYLALGSNLGPRRAHLARAVRELAALPHSRLVAVSSLYETAYVGPGEQPPYLNACLRLDTALSPEDLLAAGRRLEREEGRAEDGHMAPRPLDVDLLVHGGERRRGDRLTLPHPRLAERRFVLEPLAEVAPTLVPPGQPSSVEDLLARPEVQRQEVLRRPEGRWWEEEA